MGTPLDFDLAQVTERLGCRYLVATGLKMADAAALGRRAAFIKIHAIDETPAGDTSRYPDDPAISVFDSGIVAGLDACVPLLAPEVPVVWWLGGMDMSTMVAQAIRTIISRRNVAADLFLLESPVTGTAAWTEMGEALQALLGETHMLDLHTRAARGQAFAMPRHGPGPRASAAIRCRLAILGGDLEAAAGILDDASREPAHARRFETLRGAIAVRRFAATLQCRDAGAVAMADLLVRTHRAPRNDPRIAAALASAAARPAIDLLLAVHLAYVEGRTRRRARCASRRRGHGRGDLPAGGSLERVRRGAAP